MTESRISKARGSIIGIADQHRADPPVVFYLSPRWRISSFILPRVSLPFSFREPGRAIILDAPSVDNPMRKRGSGSECELAALEPSARAFFALAVSQFPIPGGVLICQSFIGRGIGISMRLFAMAAAAIASHKGSPTPSADAPLWDGTLTDRSI